MTCKQCRWIKTKKEKINKFSIHRKLQKNKYVWPFNTGWVMSNNFVRVSTSVMNMLLKLLLICCHKRRGIGEYAHRDQSEAAWVWYSRSACPVYHLNKATNRSSLGNRGCLLKRERGAVVFCCWHFPRSSAYSCRSVCCSLYCVLKLR